MSRITLKGKCNGYTQVSNAFIDEYMTDANEAQIKIYLYLLRCIADSMPVSVSSIVDRFNFLESDILRAIMYWDKLGLLTVETDKANNIISICLNDCSTSGSFSVPKNTEQPVESVAIQNPDSTSHFYPQNQIQEFKNMEEVKSLIFMTEHYIGKTLSKNDINTLIYIYDELHFPVELIEYLIEYCVNNGHRSMRYIEKTAIAWAGEGIISVDMAKRSVSRFKKEYFEILKAYGISGRNPVEVEIEYMSRWINELGFDLDIITEAIKRTMLNISKPSYSYTDKILSDWASKSVHHLSDIPANDKDKAKKKPTSSVSSNKFKNFNEREYDYNELAKEFVQN